MLGEARKRDEDARLLQGAGRYTGDVRVENEAALVVVRSPFASARIKAIEVDDALAMPGVLAVLTGADGVAEGQGTFKSRFPGRRPDGTEMPSSPYRLLASDRARFVGDAVAAVVAETRAQAEDAAEALFVDYEDLPAATDCKDAAAPGAPELWPGIYPGNVAFLHEVGDAEATEAAFRQAAHVVEGEFRISRVSANPMETRGALGLHDKETDSYTLYTGTQIPNRVAEGLGKEIFGIDPDRIHVIATDCGGSFGMKNSAYPEHGLVLWAARVVGRPVRWFSFRSEALLSDNHARDNLTRAALALDADGRFLALRAETLANMGAYIVPSGLVSPTTNVGGLAGVYRTPAAHVRVKGIMTHSQPTSPYRGAGRPEATYVIERLVDMAADALGVDPAALRRRNMIRPDDMPYKTPLTFTYDSGDFPGVMARALELADHAGFEARRARAREAGLLRGFGIACPIEIAGGPFRSPPPEFAEIAFDEKGDVDVKIGAIDSGQGHATSFRQILASQLGLKPRRVRVHSGDSHLIKKGVGTFGSRTMSASGTVLVRASAKIVEAATPMAAEELEVAAGDVEFRDGVFRVVGTDRAIGLHDLAERRSESLVADEFSAAGDATFPNGCHVCELEIDPDTGRVRVHGYVVVDDVGTVVNPLLLKGQIQGGVAQGLGQALFEQIVFDPETGQLLTGSFQDYCMPRADDLSWIEVEAYPVPTATNPLGVKGAGEAGVVGSLPAVMNAVVDALSPLGIRHLDMPATPDRIWRAIQAAA